jgi:leader peptidase (prepilin peptidase)/N-methyltransferase
MAAVALVLSWPWLWAGWARDFFRTLRMVFLWMLGLEK